MFNGSSNYGASCANDLGNSASDTGTALVTPVPAWFMPVMVWHPRPGK